MRVLMVTNTYEPARNGVAMWASLSVRELRAAGHEVDVLTFAHARRPVGVAGVHELPAWGGIDPDFRVGPVLALPRQVRDTAWDVVHVHHPILLGPAGVRVGRECGAAVCFTCHSVYSDYFDAYYGGAGRALRGWFSAKTARFADGCDAVFAPSGRVEQWLRDAGAGVRIERTEPPADTARVGALDRGAARRALGLDPDVPVALYAGRIADEKRVGTLLEEFAGARTQMPEGAVLVLVGAGRRLPDVRRAAERLGVAASVRFVGGLEPGQLGRWYSAADVFVSASRSETGPLTAVEAMSCGCPVVALRVPGFSDRVIDGASGLLVEQEQGALGAAVARVLADPALRARLSAGASVRARDFAPKAVTAGMLRVYDSLRS